MLNPDTEPQGTSIKHQFATVCQQLSLGDGCECTYAQVTINKILGTVVRFVRCVGLIGCFYPGPRCMSAIIESYTLRVLWRFWSHVRGGCTPLI